jgi:hypothetical protein
MTGELVMRKILIVLSLVHLHLTFSGVVCLLSLKGRQEQFPLTTRLRVLKLALLLTLCLDKGRIPATAVFHNTTLCGVVDVDNAEALAVAFRPLEVIQQ